MKLIYQIILRVSVALVVLLTAWAAFFYFALQTEINDEVDDALDNYSDMIIMQVLAGEKTLSSGDGSNNSYQIREVTREYAESRSAISYTDAKIYIPQLQDTEPARILKTIFPNDEGTYFELTVATPSFEKEDLRRAILNWIVVLYFSLLLIIIGINAWAFYRSMRPLYTLLHWLDDYTVGGENIPLKNDTKISEFKKLNDAAIRYAGRAEQLFDQQKQFIGNASHEIQTPLAVCQNRLEWLTDNTELTEEQLVEVLKTRQTIDYIVRLNKSLLFLSKIDNGQFTDNVPVDVNELLERQLALYKDIYGYRNIKVEVQERSRLAVRMNESLATALVTNLLKNAYVHNVDNGYIRIEIDASQIIFCNSAVAGALDGERIFDRFYQGSKKKGSTGLGLAIVKAIGNHYGIAVAYRYFEGEHRFILSWEKVLD